MQNYNKKKYIEILVEILAKKTGVSIKSSQSWKANVKTKELLYKEEDLKAIPIYVIRGLLLHEIGHLNYSGEVPVTDVMKKYGIEQIKYVYNCFEDMRVNKKLCSCYGDYAKSSLSTSNKNSLQFLRNIRPDGSDAINKVIPKLQQFMLMTTVDGLNEVYGSSYSGKYYSIGITSANLSRVFSKDVYSKYRYSSSYKIRDIIQRAIEAPNVISMARIIDSEFIPIIEEYLKKPQGQPQSGQGKGKGQGEGEGQDQQNKQNDKSEKDDKKDGGGKDNKKDDKKDDKKDSNGQGKDEKDDKKDDESQGNGGGNKKKEQEKQEPEDDRTHNAKHNHKIIKGFLSGDLNEKMEANASNNVFGEKAGRGEIEGVATMIPEIEAKCLMRLSSNVLRRKLGDILKKRKSVRWRGDKKSGTLVSKDIYKILTDSERPFSKKSVPDIPHYSVYIAVDSSGSMRSTRSGVSLHVRAYFATVLIKDVCEKLGFNIKVYDYNDRAKEITDDMEDYMSLSGGTDDESAMKLIEADINYNDDNIIFFITDGETCKDDSREKRLRELSRNSMFCGIGIGQSIHESTLKRNYPNYIKVDSVEKLPMVLSNLLYRLVKKS